MLLILIPALSLSFTGCAKPAPEKGANEVVVWHWMPDRIGAFEKFSKEYREKTGINVKFELYAPTIAYTSKIRSAAQADKLPDIYGVLLEMRDFASFIKAGHVCDLTPYMEAEEGSWKDIFYKTGLAMNCFPEGNQYGVKPGIYGVPIDINDIQMIYNLDLLEKAGWDTSKLPATWDEFISLGDKLKKAGIPGLVSGWRETWMIHCFADNFALNIMGEEKVLATMKGEIPYTSPAWIEVFSLFKQMKDHGLLFPGVVTMVNKEAEQIFANGRAAIAFNGSWCVNVYESMNPDLRYAVSMPPRVNPGRRMFIWGGTMSFVVNKASPVKKEAIEFLKWLTEREQQCFLAAETNNIPANRHCADILKGPIAEFADNMNSVVHPRLFPIEEFPLVTEAFDKGIQSIIIGEAAPLEIGENVEKTKLKEAKKAERLKALREKR